MQTSQRPFGLHTPTSAEREEFDESFQTWKQLLAELRLTDERCRHSSKRKSAELRPECDTLIEEGGRLQDQLVESAVIAFMRNPDDNWDLAYFLKSIVFLLMEREEYEEALRVGQLLIDNSIEDGEVYNLCGICAFHCNEFSLANRHLQKAKEARSLAGFGSSYLHRLPYYRDAWASELALREQEALAGDWPRVVLVTTQGELELELFENEAPNTVANFIRLVESNFCDGLDFFKVTPRGLAYVGCPKGDGTGDPGYTIFGEHAYLQHRNHFRGSVGMVRADTKTHGSQFYIAFVPLAHLDGVSTVFGRVVRGIEVLARLQRREPPDPVSDKISPHANNSRSPADKLVEAVVLRKRHKSYRPVTHPVPKTITLDEAIDEFIRIYGR